MTQRVLVSMLSLVWFKRDLRVGDHPALALAAAQGAVLPLYIIEPELWAQPDASARHWDFIAECLADLRRDLAALGQPLLLREGDAVTVLARLRAKHRFAQIVSHRDTGNDWSRARDQRVAAWARDTGLPWIEVAQPGVGSGDADPVTADVGALPPVAEGTGVLPSARSLKLPEDRCDFRQKGGREAGLAAMQGFLETRALAYPAALSSPMIAERSSSRLSPYLALGALSLREVTQASAQEKARRRGQMRWSQSLRRFEQQLAARDHCVQSRIAGVDRAEAQHQSQHQSPHQTRHLHRGATDGTRLQAWVAGETGLPFVDASMRYLRATGWLNARMRGMLQAVASHHLWLDWQVTGLHLARSVTDYDPCIHWPQVQICAGIGNAATPRIHDPIKQGIEQDPKGEFIRRWLPELSPLPDRFLHEPWKYPPARPLLAGRYPEPIIDPAAAARQARAVFARLRAPRAAPQTARRTTVSAAQMWLDL